MSDAKLQAAREFIVEAHYDTARVILDTMKASPTAKSWLEKLDEIAPEENSMTQWEYQEVLVKASDRTVPDLPLLSADKPFTTVEHFYTRLLNEYGAQGWELFSEEPEGGDFVRLLFKRPKK